MLHLWIAEGADTEQQLEEVNTSDTLYPFVAPLLEAKNIAQPTYAFDFADKELIKQLNTPFRSVKTIANDQAALHAVIFVR